MLKYHGFLKYLQAATKQSLPYSRAWIFKTDLKTVENRFQALKTAENGFIVFCHAEEGSLRHASTGAHPGVGGAKRDGQRPACGVRRAAVRNLGVPNHLAQTRENFPVG